MTAGRLTAHAAGGVGERDPMLRGSFPLARIAGIEVNVHPSWLVIFGLVTWSLAVGFFPAAVPDIDAGLAWALGAISAVLLFLCVLIHEFAHALVARSRGLDAHSITLFIFGGVSNLGGEARKPSIEFIVAAVGPLTSAVLSGLAFGLLLVADWPAPVAAVITYIAIINGLLALFNLIPGYPLDGGRVLRSIAWTVTGSMRRGTEIAVTVGKVVAYGFLALGFLWVLGGNLLGGIWIAAIGWFISSAADASLDQVRMEQRLAGLRVGDVLLREPVGVEPGTSVAQVIEQHLLRGEHRAVVVLDGSRPVGLVTLSDVREVPPELRSGTPVSQVMGGRDQLVTLSPRDSVRQALEALVGGDFEQAPVVEDGRLVGMVTRGDIIRQLQVREALDLTGRSRPAA
jgi:Zn-dependent protease/CBS domain-containing protein